MHPSSLRRESTRALAAAVLLTIFPGWLPNAFPQADPSQIDRLLETPYDGVVPEGLEIQARIVTIEPAEPSRIKWRHGGEGLGGKPVSGYFPKVAAKPKGPRIDDLLDSPKLRAGKPKPKAEPAPANLEIGEWSQWVPFSAMAPRKAPRRLFLTVSAGRRSQYIGQHPYGGRLFEGYSTKLEIEFRIRYQGKELKTFRSRAEFGSTVGAVIPFHRLAAGPEPVNSAFVSGIGSLLDYAKEREAYLKSLPYADSPKPEKYQMLTALNGYGEGAYHGIRYSSREVAETEGRALRSLGVNGFQGGPSFFHEQRAKGEGFGMEFARGVNAGRCRLSGPPIRGRARDSGGGLPLRAGCSGAPTSCRGQVARIRARGQSRCVLGHDRR